MTYIHGDLEIDITTGNVYHRGRRVKLSMQEYRLLLTFARNEGQILTRADIVHEMWNGAVEHEAAEGLLYRLRKRLDYCEHIVTMLNEGYEMPGRWAYEYYRTP